MHQMTLHPARFVGGFQGCEDKYRLLNSSTVVHPAYPRHTWKPPPVALETEAGWKFIGYLSRLAVVTIRIGLVTWPMVGTIMSLDSTLGEHKGQLPLR